MYARRRALAPQPTSRTIHAPASVGGLDYVNAGTSMPPRNCVQAFNVIAGEKGHVTRLGYREWCTGLTGASDNQIRTIIPFTGSAKSGTQNRVFATTSSGIWDVTDSGAVLLGAWAGATAYAIGNFVEDNSTYFGCKTAGTSHATDGLPSVWAAITVYSAGDRTINGGNVYIATAPGTSDASGGPTGEGTGITDGTVTWDYESAATDISDGTCVWQHNSSNVEPSLVHAFGDTSSEAGYGIWTVVVNSAGHHLLYCDEENGFLIYSETTGLWTAGSVTGVDPVDLVFVTFFKSRVWFVERDSASAWYLAADSISGAAVEFRMGNKFRQGGHLVGVYNWTYDGGAGIEDSLIAVSSGGDVLVWQMVDPAVPGNTSLQGVWLAPGVPYGRKVATNFGGDVLLMTTVGLIPMSRLRVGGLDNTQQYTTYQVGPLFNQLMLTRNSSAHKQWSMRIHPEDNSLMITVPEGDGAATTQLAMSQGNQSWSRYRDLPIYCSDVHGGKLYFGTVDGRVCINDGEVDARLLCDSSAYTAIQYAALGSFQNLGNGQLKQVTGFTYTVLSGEEDPGFSIEARFDFDTTEIATVSPSVPGGSSWGSAVWGEAVWGGEQTATKKHVGATGIGHAVAVAIRGAAVSRTTYVGADVHFVMGGSL